MNEGNTGEPKKIMILSEEVEANRQKVLGHIIRADADDPMRQVTFKNRSIELYLPSKRRIGRPTKKWGMTALQQA